MKTTPAPALAAASRTPIVIVLAWLLIAAKCLLVAWAVRRWQVPLDPAWLIWPTVAFGALATGLWLTHDE